MSAILRAFLARLGVAVLAVNGFAARMLAWLEGPDLDSHYPPVRQRCRDHWR